MIYKIKNLFLLVENQISEFDDIIYGRFSQFEQENEIKTDNYLKFNINDVQIKINGQEKILNSKIIKTDIYTIINNVISYIINDENNIYMHSVVVSNSKQGILIIGNFGQGKTTLANEFLKYGYKINSSDQTWLEINDLQLNQVLGSRFYRENDNIKFLDNTDIKQKVRIDKIIRIVGLCDNGTTSINEQNNFYYKIKQISDYCNWTNIAPIFTDNVYLYDIQKFTKTFLSQISNIKLYNVRGNKYEIIQKLK